MNNVDNVPAGSVTTRDGRIDELRHLAVRRTLTAIDDRTVDWAIYTLTESVLGEQARIAGIDVDRQDSTETTQLDAVVDIPGYGDLA